jgi:hypothetical protein
MQNQDDQAFALDVRLPSTASAKTKYLNWQRLGASNTQIPMGKLGYQTTSAAGSEFELYVMPATGSITRVIAINETLSSLFNGRVQMNMPGTSVTAANDLTLTSGNIFSITGATTINRIATADWQAGSVIWLVFNQALTVHSGATGGTGLAPIIMSGGVDRYVDALSWICLIYIGSNWYEFPANTRTLGWMGTATVTSNVLTCGVGGNFFRCASTDEIHFIATIGWTIGSRITIHSYGVTCTYKNNVSTPPANTAPIRCGSDKTQANIGVMEFVYDGTYWVMTATPISV